jgi:hypothetical protein
MKEVTNRSREEQAAQNKIQKKQFFSLQSERDYNRFTEVIALPLSFD